MIERPRARGCSWRWAARTRYLVLDDADVDAAAAIVAARRLRADRPGVHRDLAGVLHPGHARRSSSRRCAKAAESAIAGDGLDAGHHDGPGRSPRPSWPRTCSAVQDAAAGAASTVGEEPRDAQGLMFRPTVVADGVGHDADSPATRCSARSWPCSRSPASTRASPRVNDSTYGLTAGICTRDLARLLRLRGPRAGRRRQGEPADHRPGPERAVRRGEGLLDQHVPGAGRAGDRLLHLVEDGLPRPLVTRT